VRVLIVEDEVKLAGMMRRGVRERGLRADVATSGEDALWIAGATEYGRSCST
jgi:two-component system OmpR family response regulator